MLILLERTHENSHRKWVFKTYFLIISGQKIDMKNSFRVKERSKLSKAIFTIDILVQSFASWTYEFAPSTWGKMLNAMHAVWHSKTPTTHFMNELLEKKKKEFLFLLLLLLYVLFVEVERLNEMEIWAKERKQSKRHKRTNINLCMPMHIYKYKIKKIYLGNGNVSFKW